jgi:hypothetical protein
LWCVTNETEARDLKTGAMQNWLKMQPKKKKKKKKKTTFLTEFKNL